MLTKEKIGLIFTFNFIEFLNEPEVFYEYGVFKQVYCCKRFVTMDCDFDLLYWASSFGHLDIVIHLVSSGAQIKNSGNYELQVASEYGHLDVVKYWVENGANVSSNQNRATRWAKRGGHRDVVEYLALFGGNIRARPSKGDIPLPPGDCVYF